jgi:hypothetical protein
MSDALASPFGEDEYPEHQKMMDCRDDAFIIGAFLEDGPYMLGEYLSFERGGFPPREEFVPVSKGIQAVLAEYFEIDLDVIEQEKRAMLEKIRTS